MAGRRDLRHAQLGSHDVNSTTTYVEVFTAASATLTVLISRSATDARRQPAQITIPLSTTRSSVPASDQFQYADTKTHNTGEQQYRGNCEQFNSLMRRSGY